MANQNNNQKVEKNYVNFDIVWRDGSKTNFSIDTRKHAYMIAGEYLVTVIKNDDGTVPDQPTIIGSVNMRETRTIKTYLS